MPATRWELCAGIRITDKQPLFLHTFKDKILIVRSSRLTFRRGFRMDSKCNAATAELGKIYLAAVRHHVGMCLPFADDGTCHRHRQRLEFAVARPCLNRVQILRTIDTAASVESKPST